MEQQLNFTDTPEHYPVEVWVSLCENIGGVWVEENPTLQIRCGCTYSLEFDWEHEQQESSANLHTVISI